MAREAADKIPFLGDLWRQLDTVAIAIGKTRYSLSDLLIFLLTAIAIVVVAKLAYWAFRKLIRRTHRRKAMAVARRNKTDCMDERLTPIAQRR